MENSDSISSLDFDPVPRTNPDLGTVAHWVLANLLLSYLTVLDLVVAGSKRTDQS